MANEPLTVAQYLAALPAEHRAALEAVRRVILKNLRGGYEEGIQYRMIGYYVPHRLYPAGYHTNPKEPLPFAGLSVWKNHLSLSLMCLYGNPKDEARFRKDWAKTGKRLDMGKACIRFESPDDLALDVIGKTIARFPASAFVAQYEATRSAAGKKTPAKKGRARA